MQILEQINCQICGSPNHKKLLEKRETRTWWQKKCRDDKNCDVNMTFNIVECQECCTAFVNPRLKPEIVGDIYANYWKSNPVELTHHSYANYVCRILAKLTGNGRLLDFGCGWGEYLLEAQRLGWDAVGIEVDKDKIDWCQTNGLNAVYGDLLDQIFEESYFDAVISQQVFEHVYKPREYLREISRILRPGGILFISVPNFGGLKAKYQKNNWSLLHPVSHVTYFNIKTLTILLEKEGFSSVKTPYALRCSSSPLTNFLHPGKTFLERSLNIYFSGLAVLAENTRKK